MTVEAQSDTLLSCEQLGPGGPLHRSQRVRRQDIETRSESLPGLGLHKDLVDSRVPLVELLVQLLVRSTRSRQHRPHAREEEHCAV